MKSRKEKIKSNPHARIRLMTRLKITAMRTIGVQEAKKN